MAISLYADLRSFLLSAELQDQYRDVTGQGTRLRAPERILTQLQYEEEIQSAEESGFFFPLATTDQLRSVLNVFANSPVKMEEEHESARMIEEAELYVY